MPVRCEVIRSTFFLVIAVQCITLRSFSASGQTDAENGFRGDPYLLTTDPVSGEKLPGNSIVHYHEGRELRFASEENIARFNQDSGKYLSQIDQQMITQQLPFYPLDTCIVSGKKLGDKPFDLIYRNRLIRLASDAHAAALIREPDQYIARLDAAVIENQRSNYRLTTCLVTGDKLDGDMGEPIDIVVCNRLVRVCCETCVTDFKREPLKYLKALDAPQRKKPQAAKQ